MADRFWLGNGTNSGATTGCTGTYRNGSDASCGLIYDVANTYKGTTTCTTPYNCGFTATGGTGSSHKKLVFRFAPTGANTFGIGKTFEFDCDTDGGAGINGSSMAGMKVTIKYGASFTLTGSLAAVTGNLLRSEVKMN